MILGACTHFNQGWAHRTLRAIRDKLGLAAIRDGANWAGVETRPGVFDWSDPRTAWLDEAHRLGLDVTFLLNWGHPLYDDGHTPHTDEGRQAMARFAAAAVERFPAIAAVEVGNEWTGFNFLSGPLRDMRYADRPAAIAKLQAAVYAAVKDVRADVRVIGGAANDCPLGYLELCKSAGVFDHADGVAIHPYGLHPAQAHNAIGLVRELLPDHEIWATEIGPPHASPDDFERTVAALSAAGVDIAHWYLARQEGPADDPWWADRHLLTTDDEVTPLGARCALRDWSMTATRVRPAVVRWADGRTTALTDAPNALVDTLRDFDPRNDPAGPIFYYEEQNGERNAEYAYFGGAGAKAGGGMMQGPWYPHLGNAWRYPTAITAETVNVHWGRTVVESIRKPERAFVMPDGAVDAGTRIELRYRDDSGGGGRFYRRRVVLEAPANPVLRSDRRTATAPVEDGEPTQGPVLARASSEWDEKKAAWKAFAQAPKRDGWWGWLAAADDPKPWLEIDLGRDVVVHAMALQARRKDPDGLPTRYSVLADGVAVDLEAPASGRVWRLVAHESPGRKTSIGRWMLLDSQGRNLVPELVANDRTADETAAR